ncbi:unnamed protein product [Parnassius apollo]|uniref:(apollo) hypothetical protein n=1 Tax=Parnassius apollo TaxID=110799 RepID=A0A8S3W5Y2_PARAO|nr:unnamed protein product [Parnassius apollo]
MLRVRDARARAVSRAWRARRRCAGAARGASAAAAPRRRGTETYTAGMLCYVCYVCAARELVPLVGRGGRDAGALIQRELALLLRRAAAARGRTPQEDKLDMSLNEYANRLAEQGCLQSALAALQGTQHELAHRLQRALGLLQNERGAAQVGTQHQRQHQYGAHTAAHVQSRTHAHPTTHNDLANAFGPGVAAAGEPGWQQPARPASVGTPHGGITSRSKYKVDPSVQAAPMYNQYSYNNPVTSQPPSYGFNSPLPDQYSAASIPNPGYTPANTINPINPAPLNPMNPLNPTPNPLNPTPMNPLNHAPMNPVNSVAASVAPAQAANGGYYAPAKSVPPGWNDPPMMTSKSKHVGTEEMSAMHAGTRQWGHIIENRRHVERQTEGAVPAVSQAPITHPLFGAEPQHVPLMPHQPTPTHMPMPMPTPTQNPTLQQPYTNQQQFYPEQPNYAPYAQQAQPAYTQQVESQPPPEPTPVQKPPIPQEHAVIQAVFDGLHADCCQRASNPQMKRKLEDIQRRLEMLYDLLREHKLSGGALSALHACAESARGAQWEAALRAAAALAAGEDFAAAASFLPGLKLLLQLAAHAHQRVT